MTQDNTVISFVDESLILVDPADQVLGYCNKADCHRRPGLLHRAFSVFLFNREHQVLLQQRSSQKLLWPNFWSNACCSHPRRGETVEQAAYRRVQEELGCRVGLRFAYKFIYQATFEDVGSEHELCSVFVGPAPASTFPYNANEIAATRFVSPEKVDSALLDTAAPYTPWLRLQWPVLRRQHWPLICAIAA